MDSKRYIVTERAGGSEYEAQEYEKESGQGCRGPQECTDYILVSHVVTMARTRPSVQQSEQLFGVPGEGGNAIERSPLASSH